MINLPNSRAELFQEKRKSHICCSDHPPKGTSSAAGSELASLSFDDSIRTAADSCWRVGSAAVPAHFVFRDSNLQSQQNPSTSAHQWVLHRSRESAISFPCYLGIGKEDIRLWEGKEKISASLKKTGTSESEAGKGREEKDRGKAQVRVL